MNDPGPRTDGSFARASVLVVDDTSANLIAMEAMIGLLGHHCITASSGHEALALAATHEFAVILLDVMMPELDGFATLERLRTLPLCVNTPVILVTAHDLDRKELQRAYELGALDYITKPIAPEILRAKLNSFVAHFMRGLENRQQAEALKAKDRHISVLAHDIRNPLSVIAMTADPLQQSDDLSVRASSRRIARSVKRIQALTDDVLDFARMAAGQIIVKPVAMDMSALCHEIWMTSRRPIRSATLLAAYRVSCTASGMPHVFSS